MTTLLPEERAALVHALENGGRVEPTWRRDGGSFVSGLYFQNWDSDEWRLTRAGHIVATLLRDAPPSDITRAQELLREWREAAGSGYYDYLLSLQPNDSWRCKLRYFTGAMLSITDAVSRACDPLAAVRAAIAMTPWSGLENK